MRPVCTVSGGAPSPRVFISVDFKGVKVICFDTLASVDSEGVGNKESEEKTAGLRRLRPALQGF
jgi:hypothetical protein